MNDIASIVRIWRGGALQAVGNAALNLDDENLRRFYMRQIADAAAPFGLSVACDQSGAVLGWQALLPFDHNPAMNGHVAEWSIYVGPSSRGVGCGEALTRWAMNVADESSLQYIMAFISSENIAALRLVQKCGWARIGTLPSTHKEPARPDVALVAYLPASGGSSMATPAWPRTGENSRAD